MKLYFKTKKLQNECNDFLKAKKSYGERCSILLHQRIRELKSSNTLDEMVKYRIGRCHRLKGNYAGKYALDLEHPYRLIVEPIDENPTNKFNINIVKILEVKDYHGN